MRSTLFIHILAAWGAAVTVASALPLIPDCSERAPRDTTITAGGHFCGGETAQVGLPLQPEDEVLIDLIFDSDDDRIGMAVQWRILDQLGTQLNWDNAAVYGVVTDTMWDRASQGSCAHPTTFEVECDIFCGTWDLSAEIVERVGWNQTGTDFGSAQPIGSSSTWCGSVNGVNECANDPVWQLELATGDTLHVAAGLTGSQNVGCAVNLDLHDDQGLFLQHLVIAAAYGSIEKYATYVHTGPPGTYYLVLDRQIWDLWRYAIGFELSSPPPPCDLVATLSDYPASINRGEILRFRGTASNDCSEDLAFDQAVMTITGPATRAKTLYAGPDRIVPAGGALSALLKLPVPGRAPPGSYNLLVTIYRDGEEIDGDSFDIQVN